MNYAEARSTALALAAEYPNEIFLATNRCVGSFYGQLVVHSGDCCVVKLYESGYPRLSPEGLRVVASGLVLDTALWYDSEKRCNFIREKIESVSEGSKISVISYQGFIPKVKLKHTNVNQCEDCARKRAYSHGLVSTFSGTKANVPILPSPRVSVVTTRGGFPDHVWWSLTGTTRTFVEFSGSEAYGRPILIISH